MPEKRTINAKKFMKYLRSGAPRELLMAKFGVTGDELVRIAGKLIAAGLIARDEASALLSEEFTEEVLRAYRQTRRCYPTYHVPVYDLDNLRLEGQLLDINEKGLRVSGLSAEPGKKMSLIIQADGVAEVHPFCVEATCRWTKADDQGEIFAGFEVEEWPSIAPGLLDKIMSWLTMCES